MMTWIKLCGLSTEADVLTAVDCDVQAIGFVFAPSARQIDPVRAAELAALVPATMATVAVMLRPTQADVDMVLSRFVPDYVQADWQALATCQTGVSGKLPVYRQGDGAAPEALPDRFVYEGPQSGQGKTVDWSAARAYSDQKEMVLAGGLNPGNVQQAIAVLSPFGVDVSSGIEREKGVKDHARMREFVDKVRATERTGQH